MSKLRDAVRDIYEELDPDGGGFRTSEFKARLYSRAEEECGGDLPELTADLARLGCLVAIKEHRPNRVQMGRAYEAAVYAATSPQMDMADVAPDWGWIDEHTALEEGNAAVRKRISQLTHPETLQVIDLKRRKAAQAAAMAHRLQLIVDQNPEWAGTPSLPLGRILGLGR
tara:strand:- start:5019 stop:5528 length:510 start_codon:yes stop_codon:yes gene_type:complete